MPPFLLRLPPELHVRLKRDAGAAGMSMNEYCIAKLTAERQTMDPDSGALVARAREIAGDGLIGVLIYGSWARGDASDSSDVDMLLVVDRSVTLTRELYRRWDTESRTFRDRPVDAHFAHLPDRRVGGGVWAEAAIDGIVFADPSGSIHRALVAIRQDIADGILKRRTVHGQSYWTTIAA